MKINLKSNQLIDRWIIWIFLITLIEWPASMSAQNHPEQPRTEQRLTAPSITAQLTSGFVQRKNVLLICVDDLRPELNCFGVDYIHSPHIDRLAESGVRFNRHFVQAPTCGASRYALLTGRYGNHTNNALFQRANAIRAGKAVPSSLPTWFRRHGYFTVSVGKVSHHPGGLGGADWDDPQQPEMPGSWDHHLLPAGDWLHPRGWMHGLAHGEIRTDPSKMDVFQATAGDDTIYPDGVMVEEALRQIDLLADAVTETGQPFLLACGILRPHLPFGAPENYLDLYRSIQLPPITHPEKPRGRTTWHASAEFNRYHRWGRDPNRDPEFADDVRKHYAACVSYADAQVGKLVDRLKQKNLWEHTIVVLWGDHGWHLGEHAVWGKHTLFDASLRSPLIIRDPGNQQTGGVCSRLVQTVDLFPTLCQMTQLPQPERVDGSSLQNDLIKPASESDPTEDYAISYQGNAASIRTDRYRLILHKDGFVELYDYQASGETENVAPQFPELSERLTQKLTQKLNQKLNQ